jgi:hypothetical protein
MADEQEQTIRKGREGSRWINERPTGEDVADWFEKNVELPDGLEHKHYLPGIVLIPQNEKSKEVIGFNDGMPVQKEVENRVYIPYAKVETRVKMFWDYMALHEDWFGVIEPVEVEGGKSKGYPPGYFSMTVEQTKSSDTSPPSSSAARCGSASTSASSVKDETSSTRATGVIAQLTFRRTGKLILDAPPATKMVAALNRYGEADQFAMMKAETGAIGRALGLAGMLVIPGSGVASAEDMQEAGIGDQPVAAPPPEAAQAPQAQQMSQEEITGELRREAAAGIAKLRESNPDEYKKFTDWTRQRGIGKLDELEATALRGLTTKIKKHLEAALKLKAPTPQGESDAGAEAEAAD